MTYQLSFGSGIFLKKKKGKADLIDTTALIPVFIWQEWMIMLVRQLSGRQSRAAVSECQEDKKMKENQVAGCTENEPREPFGDHRNSKILFVFIF